eukprot:CAMPEP_0115597786 /NCGR_PEP_ID=MMETSP0272-20121206/13536_1 /TAXON_ID=71861 /ORGANISM="Scrippsiella trochoidea, Strain CCMP3099" /LENGTH=180 /DNA_ID=CAMNT_0003033177 /DNA_START=91 /DNA_END=634 /DNA_ORIENTATION=-
MKEHLALTAGGKAAEAAAMEAAKRAAARDWMAGIEAGATADPATVAPAAAADADSAAPAVPVPVLGSTGAGTAVRLLGMAGHIAAEYAVARAEVPLPQLVGGPPRSSCVLASIAGDDLTFNASATALPPPSAWRLWPGADAVVLPLGLSLKPGCNRDGLAGLGVLVRGLTALWSTMRSGF